MVGRTALVEGPLHLRRLGRIEIKSGNPQTSFDPLNRAYSLSVQMGNQEQKATSLHLMAVAYRMLNKPQEVLRNEQDALKIWRSVGQKRGLAFSLNEMAKAQASLGNNKDALPNFEEALQIRREIGDKRGLGDTLIDIGNFSNERGDYDQALKTYKEALDLERDLSNPDYRTVLATMIPTDLAAEWQRVATSDNYFAFAEEHGGLDKVRTDPALRLLRLASLRGS